MADTDSSFDDKRHPEPGKKSLDGDIPSGGRTEELVHDSEDLKLSRDNCRHDITFV